MKNLILSLTQQTVPYIKELRVYTKSVAGCILMQQLDFRFAQYPDGFFKFLSPPEQPHPNYKINDSWQEEIGFSPDEFRAAFDLIGVRYSSKKSFDQSEDKFQGKFYCSYYDRVSRLTHYFRNHEVLDNALLELITGKPISRTGKSQSLELENPISRTRQSQSLELEKPISILYTENNTKNTTEINYKDNIPLGDFVEVEIPFSDWEPEEPDREEPENLEPLEIVPFSREIQETSSLAKNLSGVQISPAAKNSKPSDADFNIFCDRWNEQKGTWAGCELSRTTGTFSPKRLAGFRKAWQEHGDRLMEKFDLACEFICTNQWHIDNPFSIDTLLVAGNITKYADKALTARQNQQFKPIKDRSYAEGCAQIQDIVEKARAERAAKAGAVA